MISAAEAPSWIPILPTPGTFAHPLYGKLEITPERNARFVQNLNERVYGQDLPIDAEHETKLSGAFGWIKEARLNEDGSADGRVEWNDKGVSAFDRSLFKYVSPEWYDEWTEPMSGTRYQDVLIGAALTTRPYFKSPHLRPLIATEDGRVYLSDHGLIDDGAGSVSIYFSELAAGSTVQKEQTAMSEQVGSETQVHTESVKPNEDELKAFREWQAGREAETTRMSELEASVKTLSETNAKLVGDVRARKFSALVREGAWPGDPEQHVTHLIALAEAVGEESELFTSHVARLNEAGTALMASGAFKPVGTDETNEHGEAVDTIDTKAKALMASESGLSYGDAVSRVFRDNPELRQGYDAQARTIAVGR